LQTLTLPTFGGDTAGLSWKRHEEERTSAMTPLPKQIACMLFGIGEVVGRFSNRCQSCAKDTSGSTMIEYALTLGGIALGGTGLTSAIGVDISAIFNSIGLDLCLQQFDVCLGR